MQLLHQNDKNATLLFNSTALNVIVGSDAITGEVPATAKVDVP